MAVPFSKVPNEIVLEIAKHVAQEYSIQYYNIGRDMSNKPIVNFGMVCRRFRQISAHLLVTRVRVACHTSSLQHLEEISHHALIRKGVRELYVSLSYFNKELCNSFGKFINFYVLDLEKYRKEMHFDKGLRDERWECGRVLESWERIIMDVDNGGRLYSRHDRRHDEEDALHLALLKEAHANYKRLHDEQEHLLRSGEFVDRVALAMSRMPLAKRIDFVDASVPYGKSLWNPPVRPGVDVHDAYYQAMTSGMGGEQTWENQEMQFAQSCLYSTLIQLPIAVHQAGISLNHVTIHLQGIQSDEAALNAGHATLQSLSSAFKSLKEVHFCGSPAMNSDDDLIDKGLKALPAYLTQMLNSPHPQKIRIDACGSEYAYRDVAAAGSHTDWVRLPGSCLSLSTNIDRKCLINVTLGRFDFHSADLLAFVSSLPMSMEWLQLEHINLLDGTWEGVIEELRLRTYDLNCDGPYLENDYLLLGPLTGGEFVTMEHYQTQRLFEDRIPQWWDRDSKISFLVAYCLRYYCKNPLRALREGNWDETACLRGIDLRVFYDSSEEDSDMPSENGDEDEDDDEDDIDYDSDDEEEE